MSGEVCVAVAGRYNECARCIGKGGQPSAMSSARILVIEDDPMVLALFRELLPTQGYSGSFAANGQEATTILASQAFDLIISDKNLPDASGIELLKGAKESNPDTETILMTAYADTISVLTAFESGVYDCLVKPFESLDDVMAKIARALDRRHITLENRRLIDCLTRANSQIEAMNRELEAQVAERTRQLTEANEQLKHLSLTDDVTGLYNQRFLYQRVDEEFRRAARYDEALSVIMIDVDHFKEVNDHHDHLFGSRVLREIGQILLQGVRGVDFVIRYGGDEFIILLPHTNLADAVAVGERLRSRIEKVDFGDSSGTCHLTISLGVGSRLESDIDSARSLLRAADMALYLAKSNGRNRLAIINDKGPATAVAGAGCR